MTDTPRAPLGQELTPAGEKELQAVVGDLWRHSEQLLQQEVQLHLSELDAKLESGKRALNRALVSGALYYAAYLTGLATLVLLLDRVLESWLAAFIVAVAASIGAYFFSAMSKRAIREAKETPARPDRFNSSRHTVHP